MMQLSMTGEYAVRTMVHLAAAAPDDLVQISDISKEWGIPEGFLRKIVAQLSKNGLIRSQRGTGGGIRLSRPADALTLLDVIEAVEGKLFLNKCLIAPGTCHLDVTCAVHTVWVDAQKSLRNTLTSKSLADLASGFSVDSSR
ncbi:MAG TPA: Rrf2 family transcriptional regulator, partial [Bacteroidota bacterium]|nr:Rrf2 family transcriptional regulator [Bacteroidota bacterium]